MTAHAERKKVIILFNDSIKAGARQTELAPKI